MPSTEATTVRIFTHASVPGTSDVAVQVGVAALAQGLEVIVIDAEADPMLVIEAGVMALPAVVIESGGVEVARRECLRSGRGLRRWMDRKLVPVEAAPVLQPAFA